MGTDGARATPSTLVRPVPIRLADGRELIYFDDPRDSARQQAADPGLTDRRRLPPYAPGSELRYDRLLEEWVAVASHRQQRTFLPPTDACPLCPSRPGSPTEVPASDYDVVVFENRFPSLAMRAPEPETDDTGAAPRRAGIGRCEVVCFTSDHHASFAALPATRVRTVVEAWADRTAALGALPGVAQVFCFENRGAEIGVTLSHPHGQIYAYPFTTPLTARMLASARRYAARGGGNLFDDVLAAERAAGTRVVAETGHWTAFVPAAARWPVEVHLYPRRRVPDLPALTDAERADFGPLYLALLGALDRYFAMPLPYIAAWYQAPGGADRELAALHLRVFSIRRAPDKLKYLAGSESAMGVWINDVSPETIAERIRERL